MAILKLKEKKKNYCHKTSILLRDVDIEKVLVSNKIPFGYLYDSHNVKPLHIMLNKTSAYAKSYDGKTKWMYLLIEEDDLLEKYNTI